MLPNYVKTSKLAPTDIMFLMSASVLLLLLSSTWGHDAQWCSVCYCIWVVVKIKVPFGSLIQYGTYYLGYPKRDPNFDNYLNGTWYFPCQGP